MPSLIGWVHAQNDTWITWYNVDLSTISYQGTTFNESSVMIKSEIKYIIQTDILNMEVGFPKGQWVNA